MDLISRKVAQTRLKEICKKYSIMYDDTNENKYNTCATEFGHAFDNLPAQNQWIPCSERMPNNTIPVLVCVNVRSVMNITTTRTAWFNTVKKIWIVHREDNEVIGEVVAWQPLPEPYKESEEC